MPRAALAAALAAAAAAVLAGPAAGAPQWTDGAAAAGIAFRTAGEIHPPDHEDNWPAFPELVGSGACWLDADGDGLDDLYLVNQRYNEHNPAWGPWADDADPHSQLYLNQGDGTFEDVSAAWGADLRIFGYSCSAADYDGDGCVDLFVNGFGDHRLLRNTCEGAFVDATADLAAPFTAPEGCGDGGKWPCMGTSSAWADYDQDGDLDLFAGTFVNTNLTDLDHGPIRHVAQPNWLFRNDGDGTFTEVAAQAGVQGSATDRDGAKVLGAVWFDVDLDGDLDLYTAEDGTPNDLLVNLGNGTFENRAAAAGVADPRAGMGIASGDYDNDGWADLFMTHFQFEHNGFYRNRGDATFEDRSGEDDHLHDHQYVGWGTAFVDFDRDGDLDIIAFNGHAEPGHATYDQRPLVYRNDPGPAGAAEGDREWVEVAGSSGLAMRTPTVARGAAFADVDLDGDVDIAVVNNRNQTARFLVGQGAEGHWLNVHLRQDGANARAVGARVLLDTPAGTQVREVQAGSSYFSQNTLALEFGLGPHDRAERVTVQWPGGGTTVVEGIAANQTVRIHRSGLVQTDTVSPRTTATFEGTRGGGGWWTSPVTAAVSAAERGYPRASGLAGTEVRADGAAWGPYQGPLAFGEGRHELRMRSRDLAGNVEPTRLERVDVDLTPPTATHALDGTRGRGGWWVSSQVTVTLAGEDALSGIAELRYRIGDGAWTVYAGPFNLTADGIHTVTYVAEDVAGHVGAEASFEVHLDHTAPSVRLTRPDIGVVYLGERAVADAITGPAYIVAVPETAGLGGARFTLAAEASDATSGMAGVDFLLDQALHASDATSPYAAPWDTGGSATGLHLVDAVAADQAGNTARHRVRVVLASLTPEGIASTAAQGPSLHAGLGPVDGVPEPPPLPGVFVVPLAWLGGRAALRRRGLR